MNSDLSTAVSYAAALHRDDTRKGTDIPYLSHLLAVTALVLEAGGSETEGAAALLHDAIEDHPRDGATAREIEERFGAEVLTIVTGCSDKAAGTRRRSAANWRERKEAYLVALRSGGKERAVMLVSLADKVHNARAIVADLKQVGSRVWERFNAGRDDQLWYYRSLADAFRKAVGRDERLRPLWDALETAVLEMEAMAAPAPGRCRTT